MDERFFMFPFIVTVLEKENLLKYLEKDLSESSVNNRLQHFIDCKSIDDNKKELLYKKACEVSHQVAFRNIPPFLLERNLELCNIKTYIIDKEEYERIKKNRSSYISFYDCIYSELTLISTDEQTQHYFYELFGEHLLELLEDNTKHEMEHIASDFKYSLKSFHHLLNFKVIYDKVKEASTYINFEVPETFLSTIKEDMAMTDVFSSIDEALTERLTYDGENKIGIYRPQQFLLGMIETINNHNYSYDYYWGNLVKALKSSKEHYNIKELAKLSLYLKYIYMITPQNELLYDYIQKEFIKTLKKDKYFEENKQKCLEYAGQNVSRFMK